METTHRFMAIIWMRDGTSLSVGPFNTIEEAQAGRKAKKSELLKLHGKTALRNMLHPQERSKTKYIRSRDLLDLNPDELRGSYRRKETPTAPNVPCFDENAQGATRFLHFLQRIKETKPDLYERIMSWQ